MAEDPIALQHKAAGWQLPIPLYPVAYFPDSVTSWLSALITQNKMCPSNAHLAAESISSLLWQPAEAFPFDL